MREPDHQSAHRRAWNLDLSQKPDRPEKAAGLASWLVNVPGAHPFWSYWIVSVISLKDLPGVKPAVKSYPAAEFEFLILALDPEKHKAPDPDDLVKNGYSFLTPIDVVEQFHGISEADAIRLVEAAVKTILAGHVSPDQDYRSVWKSLIAGTVQHFSEGKHPLN